MCCTYRGVPRERPLSGQDGDNPGAVHYAVADQPEAVAELIERHAAK